MITDLAAIKRKIREYKNSMLLRVSNLEEMDQFLKNHKYQNLHYGIDKLIIPQPFN